MSPVPVVVVTGFLGAGKTTLINTWLGLPELSSTAVIVNEFGAIGIDHALIETARDDMLMLTTGCICCAARGELVDALTDLLERRRADRVRFDRVVVETTGLADPGPVLNAMLAAPALMGVARVAGVITLVSATEGHATFDRYEEARRQVAFADRILFTKTDLTGGSRAVESLTARMSRLNPAAVIGDARHAAGDPSALLVFAARSVSPPPAVRHHHHAADAAIRSVVLETGPVRRERLEAFLALVLGRYGEALLRIKGLAAIDGDIDRPVVVQAVGPLLHPVTRLAAWPEPHPRTRLVAILDGTDPAGMAVLWDDMFGPPRTDRPDAAALMPAGNDRGLF